MLQTLMKDVVALRIRSEGLAIIFFDWLAIVEAIWGGGPQAQKKSPTKK